MAEHPGDRLRETHTFRGGDSLMRWRAARIGVIGAGHLGSELAPVIVRSGASVWISDFESVSRANLSNQRHGSGFVGRPKVESVRAQCDALVEGRVEIRHGDIRHVGLRTLERLDVIIDCSDDPALAWYLTDVSNGLRRPLLRAAVDGSGKRELGRVLTSHGGAGHACQLCPLEETDLTTEWRRTPCEDAEATEERQPTRAGVAIATVVAGVCLLQAQRLIGGNDLDRVLDRELILDMTANSEAAMRLERSPRCISRHERWSPVPLDHLAEETTVAELLAVIERDSGAAVRLEPYANPLSLEAVCACGERLRDVAGLFKAPPICPSCGKEAVRASDSTWPAFGREEARELGILERTLADLGLPLDGSLIVARARARGSVRYVLKTRTEPLKGAS